MPEGDVILNLNQPPLAPVFQVILSGIVGLTTWRRPMLLLVRDPRPPTVLLLLLTERGETQTLLIR